MDIQKFNLSDHLLLHCTNVIDELSFYKISNYLTTMAWQTSSSVITNKEWNDIFGDGSVCGAEKKKIIVDCSTNNKNDYIVLHKIFSAIEKILSDHIKKEVRMTGFVIHQNNLSGKWHTHRKEFIADPFNFSLPNNYVVVFYLHKEWDDIFGGTLKVRESENNPIQSFKCDPNSCVIHSASLSHGVGSLNLNFLTTQLKRIVMYSHWVEVDNNDTSSN